MFLWLPALGYRPLQGNRGTSLLLSSGPILWRGNQGSALGDGPTPRQELPEAPSHPLGSTQGNGSSWLPIIPFPPTQCLMHGTCVSCGPAGSWLLVPVQGWGSDPTTRDRQQNRP